MLGDCLISHAYHLCSSLGSTHASRRIAAVTNTVCEGELIQIENRGNFAMSEAMYLDIIRRKTAALTEVCCELGGWASGAEAETVSELAAYGVDLGIAFQIVDDLLDLTATQREMGKTVGRDAEMGKLTLPLIRFMQNATPHERARLETALSNGCPNKTAEARRLIAGTDAIEYAFDSARSYVQSAIGRLAELPNSEAKEALIAAAEFVIERRG